MHGIVKPPADAFLERPDRVAAIKAKIYEYRFFLLLVVLPTLIVAAYYYLIASDQYESEADFVVRSAQGGGRTPTGIASLLTLGTDTKNDEARSVIDYLESTEATLEIERSIGLSKRFSQSGIDIISRLKDTRPSPEDLRKYYKKQVKLKFDKDTGITKLTVHAFTPTDAYVIATNLLHLGEARVNSLNLRSNADALFGTSRQLAEAENELRAVQVKLQAFRTRQGDIDPEASGKAQISMVAGLTSSVTAARAQLASMRGIISPNSPQYIAAQARLRALEAEMGRQDSRLAGQGAGTIASTLGGYEGLRVRQDFAEKRYQLAAGAYETSREDARKKEIYLVRVVNPNMPVDPLFPERARIVLTVFGSLVIAYGIGWLLMSGIREHAKG